MSRSMEIEGGQEEWKRERWGRQRKTGRMRKERDNGEAWRRESRRGRPREDGRRGELVCKARDRPETDLTPSSRFRRG